MGLAIEGVAIAGDALRFGRLGLLVAAIGLCHGFGWLRLPGILLLLWIIPLPSVLLERLATPEIQILPGMAAAAMIPGLNFELINDAPMWTTQVSRLLLPPPDGALAMMFGLAGIGLFKSVSVGSGATDSLLRSIRWSLTAIPLQFVLILIAALIFSLAGSAYWARLFIGQSGWLLVVGLGLILSIGVLFPRSRSMSGTHLA